MLRSWLRPLALTLALATLGSGCATTVVSAERRSTHVDLVSRGTVGEGAVEKTHHHDGAVAALYVAGAFLFVGAVVADVIILPVSAPCHRPFVCCEGVVHVCYR